MEKIINSGDIEIEKQKFHQHKEPISIQHIDINKMTVSNKVFSDKKGYKYFKKLAKRMLKKNRPLCIFVSEITAYRKDFDETKYMSFLIKDDELFEKYNEICEKVKNSFKEELDSKPVYNEKDLKAKIKSYNVKKLESLNLQISHLLRARSS